MLNRFSLLAGMSLCLAIGACTTLPPPVSPSPELDRPPPERATGLAFRPSAVGRKFMVSAANPLAVGAGAEMLRAGGTAVDAAVAVQMVLTLVEPQSSGIGGGGFLMHFDGRSVQAYDGRETAPALADQDLFRQDNGQPMAYFDAVVSGRSVGVPGVLRMLELAHRQHGRLPWKTLFKPAIRLAEQGFTVSPRLAMLLQTERHLQSDPVAADYFYDQSGRPVPVGHVLRNPALAQVLKEVARGGADAFYQGDTAVAIAAKVAGHASRPGRMTAADLASYRAKERKALCTDHRRWTVCGMPPPSSGGIAVAQILGILKQLDISRFPPRAGVPDPEGVHLFAEAGRLAYADRGRFIADPDYAPLPAGDSRPLVDEAYLADRARLVGRRSMQQARPGSPFRKTLAWGDDRSMALSGTTHLSIVDSDGNAVSMTTSIENAFGSRQMVRGFLLNNQLTDFSFDAADATGPIANRVEPGKRPRSAMAPTLVFERESGKLFLVLGSPGGPAIINYVAKALVGVMDWNLGLQQAINLPNFGSRNGPTELEEGRTSPALTHALKAKDHLVRLTDQTSGLQGIMRLEDAGGSLWSGASDPRREGAAQGE